MAGKYPPADVSVALSDLQLDFAGVAGAAPFKPVPAILRQKNEDGWSWFLMSDKVVAIEFKVSLAPAKDGTATLLSTEVNEGDLSAAPNGGLFVPLVREAFASAVDAEIDPLMPAEQRLSSAELAKRRQKAAAMATALQVAANPGAMKKYAEDMQRQLGGDGTMLAGPPAEPRAQVAVRPGQPTLVPRGTRPVPDASARPAQ